MAVFSLRREVNRRFLVNEHGDLSIFSLFLSPANASFLYSEYKQISVVETSVINGNVNFAATSEDKFVASRAQYVSNNLIRCRAFVLKETVNCFLKSCSASIDKFHVLRPPYFFCSRETLTERFK